MSDSFDIVIIGAGLGACTFAQNLTSNFKIAILDRTSDEMPVIKEDGHPAGSEISLAYGKGGTTKYWHNGLIKIPINIFKSDWPFGREILDPYYKSAIEIFGKIDEKTIEKFEKEIRFFYKSIGLSQDIIGESLFYPSKRINTGKMIDGKGNITYLNGTIRCFELSDAINKEVKSVSIKTSNGIKRIVGKNFIISAGGLNTPIILNNFIFNNKPKSNNILPGEYYEDHPTAFVLKFKSNQKIYKYWNKKIGYRIGSIRIPLNIDIDGISVAFYMRPSYKNKSTKKIQSRLSEIRNNPWKIGSYKDLFLNIDDFIEAISFKTGFTLPTNNYSILMVAAQSYSTGGRISSDAEGAIVRKWNITSEYLETLDKAINILRNRIDIFATDIELLDWKNEIKSSAHHSSTARMGHTKYDSVCDSNGKVFEFENLYVNDGSLISSSGYSNTGLTIAALALRMSNYFNVTKNE